MAQTAEILTPVGRLVMGSLYKPQTTDADGKPLLVKNGPNAGQPTKRYFFALAIPKDGTGRHWAETPWGAKIWQTGHGSFPQGQAQNPAFAWKIVDGDSAVPNTKGIKPCDREGYRGHWVLSFSSGFAPKTYRLDAANQPVAWPDVDAINLGDYVEVLGNVGGNDSPMKPGVFLNHSMVCFRGYGQRIIVGPDPTQVGFGTAAAPQGASAVPVGAALAPTPPAGTPAAPPPPAAATVVQPSTTFMAPPGATAAPTPAAGVPLPPGAASAPVAGPPAVQIILTPKANGASYEQLIAAGWTDALLREHGMMV